MHLYILEPKSRSDYDNNYMDTFYTPHYLDALACIISIYNIILYNRY